MRYLSLSLVLPLATLLLHRDIPARQRLLQHVAQYCVCDNSHKNRQKSFAILSCGFAFKSITSCYDMLWACMLVCLALISQVARDSNQYVWNSHEALPDGRTGVGNMDSVSDCKLSEKHRAHEPRNLTHELSHESAHENTHGSVHEDVPTKIEDFCVKRTTGFPRRLPRQCSREI